MKVSVLPWPKFDPWPIPSKWKAHQKEWYSILICITSKSIGQNGSNPFKKNMPVKFHQNSMDRFASPPRNLTTPRGLLFQGTVSTGQSW